MRGASATCMMVCRHFVEPAMASSWLSSSWSTPSFLPIWWRGICPAIIRTRDEAEYAVFSPAAAFSRPGPGTATATPMPPPARA